jgi:glutamate--cysteine ligase
VREYISRGVTPAQELLEKYHGAWNGRVEPLFEEYAY